MLNTLRIANLALLILFPIAWFAPLLRAGLMPNLPFFGGLDEISVISGLQSLWGSDVFQALIVTAFAIFAPYLKTIGLALVHFDLLKDKVLPVLGYLGKLAMADIFLIALYVVVVKGAGRVAVEGGGCSGFQYEIVLDEPKDDDLILEGSGQKVVVDAISLPFLANAVIDFSEELIGARFVIENPNATSACGCGTSFSM